MKLLLILAACTAAAILAEDKPAVVPEIPDAFQKKYKDLVIRSQSAEITLAKTKEQADAAVKKAETDQAATSQAIGKEYQELLATVKKEVKSCDPEPDTSAVGMLKCKTPQPPDPAASKDKK